MTAAPEFELGRVDRSTRSKLGWTAEVLEWVTSQRGTVVEWPKGFTYEDIPSSLSLPSLCADSDISTAKSARASIIARTKKQNPAI